MPLSLQFLLSLEHLVLDLLLIGCALEFVEFLLGLYQLQLVLLDERLLLVREVLVEFGVEFLDGAVQGCLGLVDHLGRILILCWGNLFGGLLLETIPLH